MGRAGAAISVPTGKGRGLCAGVSRDGRHPGAPGRPRQGPSRSHRLTRAGKAHVHTSAQGSRPHPDTCAHTPGSRTQKHSEGTSLRSAPGVVHAWGEEWGWGSKGSSPFKQVLAPTRPPPSRTWRRRGGEWVAVDAEPRSRPGRGRGRAGGGAALLRPRDRPRLEIQGLRPEGRGSRAAGGPGWTTSPRPAPPSPARGVGPSPHQTGREVVVGWVTGRILTELPPAPTGRPETEVSNDLNQKLDPFPRS